MATIVHFEIPADEVDRARKFYTELFGWQIEQVPDMEYWFITTSGDKPIGGGMMKRQHPKQPIVDYIDVESVEAHAAKVKELGGTVVVPKMAVPGMGYFAVCLDTEGNHFGLWENDFNAR